MKKSNPHTALTHPCLSFLFSEQERLNIIDSIQDMTETQEEEFKTIVSNNINIFIINEDSKSRCRLHILRASENINGN